MAPPEPSPSRGVLEKIVIIVMAAAILAILPYSCRNMERLSRHEMVITADIESYLQSLPSMKPSDMEDAGKSVFIPGAWVRMVPGNPLRSHPHFSSSTGTTYVLHSGHADGALYRLSLALDRNNRVSSLSLESVPSQEGMK
jgi:hypothetical protein